MLACVVPLHAFQKRNEQINAKLNRTWPPTQSLIRWSAGSIPKARPPVEQMALPAVRHSLSWREEGSVHVTTAGRLSAAAKDDGDEAMAATIRSSSALVEGFMVWLVDSLSEYVLVIAFCSGGIMRLCRRKHVLDLKNCLNWLEILRWRCQLGRFPRNLRVSSDPPLLAVKTRAFHVFSR